MGVPIHQRPFVRPWPVAAFCPFAAVTAPCRSVRVTMEGSTTTLYRPMEAAMLKDFARATKPEKEELKARTAIEQARLAANQIRIKNAKVPVMVIFEGWGSAGKGTTLAKVIKEMDPRFFQAITKDSEPTDEERRGHSCGAI